MSGKYNVIVYVPDCVGQLYTTKRSKLWQTFSPSIFIPHFSLYLYDSGYSMDKFCKKKKHLVLSSSLIVHIGVTFYTLKRGELALVLVFKESILL
jgi:hypothetical protein